MAAVVVAIPSSEGADVRSEAPELGEAPRATAEAWGYAGRSLAVATVDDGFRVDVSSREQVRSFYNTVYASSEGAVADWTGAYDGCQPGTTTSAFKDAVIRRVNYFRAMAGLPAGVSWNAEYSAKAQQAAMIMSAHNGLSHNPPNTWTCYTQEGAEAAANSNLALGSYGPDSVDGYMQDHGAGNAAAGHRRWLLYPQTQVMGSGDVLGDGTRRPANAVWVFDGRLGTTRPETRERYVAWPPPGYVPYTQVYPRWSFGYPGADFSTAAVTLSSNGIPVAVRLEPLETRVGEPTLVWYAAAANTGVPATFERPAQDIEYSVEVSGVRVGSETLRFTYQVRAFDPQVAGPDTVVPSVTGPAQIPVGAATSFGFVSVPGAGGYEWRQASRETGNVVEGAETQLAGFTDRTSGGYTVAVRAPVAAGSYAFHLAHPSPAKNQALIYDRAFLAGATAELRFKSRLGWSSVRQRASVQVSLDEGKSWAEVYGQAGTGGAGEVAYATRTVALASLAGRTVQFRFAYEYLGTGTYYPQTDEGIGWYFDEIEFRGLERLGAVGTPAAAEAGAFAFVPASAGAYLLQVRALVYGGYPLDWGPAFPVEAAGTTPPTLTWIGLPRVEGSRVNLEFRVSNGTAPGRYELLRKEPAAWTWVPVTGATLEVLSPGRDFRYSVDTGGEPHGFYRVRGF